MIMHDLILCEKEWLEDFISNLLMQEEAFENDPSLRDDDCYVSWGAPSARTERIVKKVVERMHKAYYFYRAFSLDCDAKTITCPHCDLDLPTNERE